MSIRSVQLFKKLKFRDKLLLFCTFIVLIPIVVTGTFFIDQITKLILEQNRKEALSHLYLIAESFQNDITLAEDLSDELYLNEFLQKELVLTKDKGDSGALYTDIIYPVIRQSRILHNQLFKSITVYINNRNFLQNGDEIIYADDSIHTLSWYKTIIDKKSSGKKIWASNVDDNLTYSLYRRLDKYAGKLAGVLRIQINQEHLMGKLTNGQAREYYIINSAGNIISSNCQETIGKSAYGYPILESALIQDSETEEFLLDGRNYSIATRTVTGRSSIIDGWKMVSITSDELILSQIAKARNTGITICLVLLFVFSIAVIIFSGTFTKRIALLAQSTKKVLEGDYGDIVEVQGKDEISELSHTFNDMLFHLNELIYEVYEKNFQMQEQKLKQKETELILLQNQINPHFLYNTLDAIRMHAVINDDLSVSEMLVNLSNILRYNISKSKETVTLGHELTYIQEYFSIIKMRHADFCEMFLQVPKRFYDVIVLKLLLQPLVENAIKHGFKQIKTGGVITITAREDAQYLLIEVEDNGIGIDEVRLAQMNEALDMETLQENTKSIGLSNVNSRIKLHYGKQYGIRVKSTPCEKTVFSITLPKPQKEKSYVVESN